MTLIKRNINSPFFPTWLEDFFPSNVNQVTKSGLATVPMVNVFETDKNYKIELAVPGMKKEEVNINLENDILTISSENEDNIDEVNNNCTKREYFYSTFTRSFTLPEAADKESVAAKFENGVLEIIINKKKEEIEKAPRKIEIK